MSRPPNERPLPYVVYRRGMVPPQPPPNIKTLISFSLDPGEGEAAAHAKKGPPPPLPFLPSRSLAHDK